MKGGWVMRCEICGGEFRPSGHGKRQRYCSESCRNKAKYRRRKNGVASTHRTKPEPAPVELDRREFERMMDDSLEDVLRMNRDRLKAALDDPGTPANALPGISRQLIDVCERLQGMSGQGGLFDDESTEVVEDVGASIV